MAEIGIEKRIVASVIQSRQAYDKIKDIINVNSLTAASVFLLSLVDSFYSRDSSAKKVDKEFLIDRIKNDVPSPQKQNLYSQYAEDCSTLDVSALNVAHLVVEIEGKESAAKLAAMLANSAPSDPAVLDALAKHAELVARNGTDGDSGTDTELLHNVSVEEINRTVSSQEGRIKLISKAVTEALNGGLLPGHHVVIIARPETGKTGLVVTGMRSLVRQKRAGIYFGNEDPIRAVIERTQGCISGMSRLERLKDPEAATAVLEAQGYKYVRFRSITPGSVRELERDIIAGKATGDSPQWIIVDQLRNLQTKAENRTNQLETIATDLRTLAKKHNILCISVTQAGDSADQKLILDMGDIDSSNTGIPAQADVIIGIGVNKEYEQQGLRMISFCKNKTGAEIPHVHFPMKFNHMLSRYEDI